jgi:hypothetical protein
MSNAVWIIVVSGMVFAYKLAPAPSTQRSLLLSATLVALGVVYGLTT